MNSKEARKTVEAVLQEADIQSKFGSNIINCMAAGLLIASQKEYWTTSLVKESQRKYDEAQKRIKLLEKLILTYDGNAPESLTATLTAEKSTPEPYARENKRPTTARNAGAKHIFEELVHAGINKWQACGLIAAMFINAGISDKPLRDTTEALYLKMKRITPVKYLLS